MKRLGMPVSDDSILRHLKRQVARLRAKTTVRVAGIDDWSWRKGRTYGTIIVDLERREVVDVLQDRTTSGTAGSVNTPRSNSSAAIAAVFMRRAHERARLRRGKSLTDSISCRTCARRSRHS
jgi:hypothetical protein